MQAVLVRFRALHPSRRAVVLMLATVICFSVLEPTGKYLGQFYPVAEVVWARYAVHMLLMVVLLVPRLGWTLVRTAQPGGQIPRASLLLGSAGALGHLLLIKALEIERASVLSPIGYTQLLWVTVLGFLVFGQLPDGHAVVGMAIIVGSGLYVAWGHRARRNEEPDSAIE